MTCQIIDKYKSPNYSQDREKIRFIVIHATDLSFKESMDILCNHTSNNRVSAHYLIDRDGKVYNLVDEEYTAWHAGKSHWSGVDNINLSSIGIEVVCEQDEIFLQAQYESLIWLCKNLQKKYDIHNPNNIVAHSDIAIGRKFDPGHRCNWHILAESGVGVIHQISLQKQSKQEIIDILQKIGYNVQNHETEDILRAFSLRHDLLE